jgi:hypothetical protein
MRGAGSDPKQDRIRAASKPVAVAGLTLPEPLAWCMRVRPNVPNKTTDTSAPDVANSGLFRQAPVKKARFGMIVELGKLTNLVKWPILLMRDDYEQILL